MPSTTVHRVRHGEVENPNRVLYGRLPGFGLSAHGRRQAEVLGGHFAGAALRMVRSSPLERAVQTAGPIAGRHGLSAATDDRLTEAANLFQGVRGSLAWWLLRHPSALWALRNWREPTWGEPNTHLVARLRAAIDDARREFPGEEVVLVSHQAPIWEARRFYEHRPLASLPSRRQCALASVTTLRFAGDAVQVSYADPAAAVLGDAGRDRPGA